MDHEQVAGGMVRVAADGGSPYVELTAPGVPPLRLWPHQNPALADAEANQLRALLGPSAGPPAAGRHDGPARTDAARDNTPGRCR
jgi:hypothetical protein